MEGPVNVGIIGLGHMGVDRGLGGLVAGYCLRAATLTGPAAADCQGD
jgi:hypothetical protein